MPKTKSFSFRKIFAPVDCVNKGDFKGQRAAVLQAVKVGGQKKILPIALVRTRFACAGLTGRIFFRR